MQYEVALIPVLAGYWVIKRTHLLKHAYSRQTDYRTFFDPAVTGGALLAISWTLIKLLGYLFGPNGPLACLNLFSGGDSFVLGGELWQSLIPSFPNAPVLLGTLFLALAIPGIVNRKWREDEAGHRWALENETEKGRLLRESIEQGSLVEVALASGRSVVGLAASDMAPHHGFEGHISLSPELSGYRDPKTHKLVITAEYEGQGDDFRVILLVDETASVSHFDPDSPYLEWRIPGLNF